MQCITGGSGRCTGCIFFFFQAEDGIRDSSVTGVQTCALPISNSASAFETFVREKADALFVATDPMLLSERDAIAAFAARERIPAIHFERQYALGGGLISYGTSISGIDRQAGV